MMSTDYEYTPVPRVQTLEEQLIFCELSGKTTKAILLRSTLNALKIAREREDNDLAKFWNSYDAET